MPERAAPGPLASASPAARNLKQAFADESTPFGIRDPLLHAARVAMYAPGAPNAGQAYVSVSIAADGTVRDVLLLSAPNEGEAWSRVRQRVAAALRERLLAVGARARRA